MKKLSALLVVTFTIFCVLFSGCDWFKSDDPDIRTADTKEQPGNRYNDAGISFSVTNLDAGTEINVLPPNETNLLAQKIVITTDEPCSMSGMAFTEEEPGYLLSLPNESPVGKTHEFWFFGLLPETRFTFEFHRSRNKDTVLATGWFETQPLPSWAPIPTRFFSSPKADKNDWYAVAVNTGKIENEEQFTIDRTNVVILLDKQGRIRYFREVFQAPVIAGLLVLNNGTMIANDRQDILAFSPNGDLQTLPVNLKTPTYYPIHHVFDTDTETLDRTLLLYSRPGFGYQCDLETPSASVVADGVAAIDKRGREIWRWDMFRHLDELPPTTFTPDICQLFFYGFKFVDLTHANSVNIIEDENAFLISLRHVLRIMKVDIATGDIIWQLGPGLDFEWIGDEPDLDKWFYMQHDATLLDNGHILMFDNGNCRTDSTCMVGPYSRALELELDEKNMTVKPVWEYRVPFSPARGCAQRHPDNGNTLIGTGITSSIIEVNSENDVQFEIDYSVVSNVAAVKYYPSPWIYENR